MRLPLSDYGIWGCDSRGLSDHTERVGCSPGRLKVGFRDASNSHANHLCADAEGMVYVHTRLGSFRG